MIHFPNSGDPGEMSHCAASHQFLKYLIDVISYDHVYDEAASFESLSAGIHHFNVQVEGEMQKLILQ